MESEKINELIEMGISAITDTRLFGLTSAAKARRVATGTFVGGLLVGGAVTAGILMRGKLFERFEEVKEGVSERASSLASNVKEKVQGAAKTFTAGQKPQQGGIGGIGGKDEQHPPVGGTRIS